MDLTNFIDIVVNQGIWCIMFVFLFLETRKDSKERENRLMCCLDKQGEQLEEITITLGKISQRLDDVEGAVLD